MEKSKTINIGRNKTKKLNKIKKMEDRIQELKRKNRLTQKIEKMFKIRISKIKSSIKKENE
jgi:hypothetical protein